jgi:M6 family metalloprotease-like protein
MSLKKRDVVVIAVLVLGLLSISMITYNEITPQSDPTAPGTSSSEIMGEINITVIPVRLPDIEPTTSLSNLSRLVFETLNSYFLNQSYGKAWLSGRIINWIDVPRNSSYYDRGSLQSLDSVAKRNASEGVKLFRNDALSQITWTRSNFTRHVILVYSGRSTIHPHHRKMDVLVDGNSEEFEVSVVPELYSLATIAHEIAHGFDLHDLYNKPGSDRLGPYMGRWALMGSTSGMYLPSMCGYSRSSIGWIESNEIVDVSANSTHTLIGLSVSGEGKRLLRIVIDDWRYYLVEARTNRENNSGILITRVDLSRNTGGYGRVELIRSYRGSELYDTKYSAFRTGDRYTDGQNGIIISNLQGTADSFIVEVGFAVLEAPTIEKHSLPIGTVIDVDSVTLSNGTTYFAFCGINYTTGERGIHLYRWDVKLVLITRTPAANDTFNPVLVAEEDAIMLIYESIYDGKHHIIANFSNRTILVSGQDDARNPSATTTLNHNLYVGYENRTSDENSIIVRKASNRDWNEWTYFSYQPSMKVVVNVNGTPSSPMLRPANNDVIMAYLRNTTQGATLELIWDMHSPNDVVKFGTSRVLAYDISILTEYRMFISITHGSHNQNSTSINYWGPYLDEVEVIATHEGVVVGSAVLLGFWQGYQTGDTFHIHELWNSYKQPGDHFVENVDNEVPMEIGLCSFHGTTTIFSITSTKVEVFIRLWLVSSVSEGAEPSLFEAIFSSIIGIVFVSILALAIHLGVDVKIRARLSKIQLSKPH